MPDEVKNEKLERTKYRLSKYNLFAKIPDKDLIGCVNLLTGNYALLSFQEVSNLYNSCFNEKFIRQGFLVNYDEQEGLNFLNRKNCGFSGTVNLTICPTLNCNFNCPYCFENHRAGKMSEEVQNDVMNFIEKMVSAFKADKISVTWFGGEPLLGLDIIKNLSEKIISFANKKKIHYKASIITNGYLLTQETADLLFKLKISNFQITLDGIEETHNKTRHLSNNGPTFNKIINNLTNIKFKQRINIRYNINENNVQEETIVKKFVQNLAKISGNSIVYYPALVLNNEIAEKRKEKVDFLDLEKFSEYDIDKKIKSGFFYRGSYCGSQILSFVTIDELGNLYKCWEDVGKLGRSFGKIKRWNPLSPINSADNPQNLIEYCNSFENLDTECKNCVWLPVCQGGCPQKKIFTKKICVTYKNNAEDFVLKYINYKERIKSRYNINNVNNIKK